MGAILPLIVVAAALVLALVFWGRKKGRKRKPKRGSQEKALEFGGLADRPRWMQRSMLSDIEVYRAAQSTIQAYGDGAVRRIGQRADELMGGRTSVSGILVDLVCQHQEELEDEAGRYLKVLDLL